ncbi:MAG: peptidylprolyl isomerase, partial [Gammaproteobacteria bacterium]
MDQNDTFIGLLLAAIMLAVLLTNTWNSAPAVTTAHDRAVTTGKPLLSSGSATISNSSTPNHQDTAMSSSEIVNVTMTTSLGDIKLELYADKAPLTVANFVSYA